MLSLLKVFVLLFMHGCLHAFIHACVNAQVLKLVGLGEEKIVAVTSLQGVHVAVCF